MNVEKFSVVEWTIENFSCWNEEFHGKLIKSSILLYNTYTFLELFPKRTRGLEEHLVVRLRNSNPVRFVGELFFIGSDGSLLCTQQVNSECELDVLELPSGLTYKKVISQIKKNEALKGDRLTICFREKSSTDLVEYRNTTIKAFDALFKITPGLLNHLKSSSTEISWIQYPPSRDGLKKDYALGNINLLASIDQLDHSKIELAVANSNYKVSVHTRMTVLNNEDVRTEENEYLFLKAEKWTFSNSLTIEEAAKDGFSLILHFKIIPPVSCVHSVDLRSGCTQAFSTIPPIEFRHLSSIAPKENISKILTDVSNQPDNSFKILSKELMRLYQDQEFSDFQLKCGDVLFPVHKNILSARSPVFQTMLSTDMQEAASSCMDIDDFDPSTLGLFLAYLYTGGTSEELQGESALKLYYAADKYQVPSLKKECADFLSANVSVLNVCDILSLADKYQHDQLTSVAHEFLLKNFNDVLRSDEWMSFMKSEPLLAVETVTRFAAKDYVTISGSL